MFAAYLANIVRPELHTAVAAGPRVDQVEEQPQPLGSFSHSIAQGGVPFNRHSHSLPDKLSILSVDNITKLVFELKKFLSSKTRVT